MNKLSYFKKLKKLFSKSGSWTQFDLARDKDGNNIQPENKDAVSFCLLGGIRKVCRKPLIVWELRRDLIKYGIPTEYKYRGVSIFNDSISTTREDVLVAIDKTITSLEGAATWIPNDK